MPDVYGMKQPKWIDAIEAVDHWEPGYWVVRGWSARAQMNSTAIIDIIDVNKKISSAEGQPRVPIGGIAFAGARGISKVEVRIDDAEWLEAKLRAPLSDKTWVIWRYEMPFEAGEHRFAVRCYDGNGAVQISEPSPPHPEGATGLHSQRATLLP